MSAPCITIVRFDHERTIAYRNSITRNGRIIRSFGGNDLFMSDEAEVFEGRGHRKRGAGVLYFPDVMISEKWMESDTEIRQQDWLGGMADVVCIPLLEMPVPDCRALVVFDLQIKNEAKFFERYLPALTDALSRSAGRLLAATLKKKTLKGSWQPQFALVQQWPSLRDFDAWYQSEDTARLRALRLESADCYAFKFEQYF